MIRSSISRKMGAILFLSVTGTLGALAAFLWYFARTTAVMDVLVVSSNLRLNCRILRDFAAKTAPWDEGDRQELDRLAKTIDGYLPALKYGGRFSDLRLPPPPSAALPSVTRTEQLWAKARPMVQAIVAMQPGTPQALAIREQLRPQTAELLRSAIRTVGAFERSRLDVRSRTLNTLTGICVLDLAWFVLGMFFVQRSIVRPVRLLEAAAARIRQGNFTHPAAVVTQDELASLTRTFNDMATHISKLLQKTMRSEASLRSSQESMARAQSIAHFGSWEQTFHPDELRWSDETYRIFGMAPESGPLTSSAFFDRVHPDDLEMVRSTAESALRERSVYSIEHRIVKPDGTQRMVREQAEVVFDADGAPRLMAGTVLDITDQKQMEERLLQSQKLEAIGQLAGGIAHDFNNLLTVILGHGELLATGMASTRWAEDVVEIQRAGERAADLTRQLLAFSRRQVLQPMVLDLNKSVKGIEKMLSRLIGEHIVLTTVLEPSLGHVRADPAQIEQVIINLAVNARDAMPKGGRLLIETANADVLESDAARVSPTPPGPYVTLAVTDNGTGMDSVTKARIFEPFFTTKERGRGTGLGLATVYGIVKQSSGYIWVYSELEHGTVFRVYLPRVDSPLDAMKSLSDSSADFRGTGTVLLVEDQDEVLKLVESVLTQHGYKVISARTPQEALSLSASQSQAVDLLLTDVVMPGMSGLTLAAELRTKWPGLHVLFMSGYTESAISSYADWPSEAVLLQKPFHISTLTLKVREALSSGSATA